MKVLHVIPDAVLRNESVGAFKDVLSRRRWLEERAAWYEQMVAEKDDPALAARVRHGTAPTHILVEYTLFPRLTAALGQTCPEAKLLVRAHNIEPLQHLDNSGLRPPRGRLWLLYGMARLFRQDVASARRASELLSINEWEVEAYWRRIVGRSRATWLPYVCPSERFPVDALPYAERNLVVCVPTSQKNRKSWDLVARFLQMARTMAALGSRDVFVVTGNLSGWGLPACPEVTFTGFVEDLSELLGRSRAVALLSPLGYGFKTTIADAWAAGAHVLAHPDLARRNPRAVARHLIPLDSDNSRSVAAAMDRLGESSGGMEWHRELERLFEETMSRVFASGDRPVSSNARGPALPGGPMNGDHAIGLCEKRRQLALSHREHPVGIREVVRGHGWRALSGPNTRAK